MFSGNKYYSQNSHSSLLGISLQEEADDERGSIERFNRFVQDLCQTLDAGQMQDVIQSRGFIGRADNG